LQIVVWLAVTGGGGVTVALADPPSASAAQDSAPSGNFFSSVKQAFKQDLDQEVVRGHFDVGSPPDAHRYYCLVDAKTGRRETNGVGGEPVLRRDGMTGIKGGAVSFYSCTAAEQQGILETGGYQLSPAIRGKIASAPPAQPAAPRMASPAAPAAQEAGTSGAAPVDDMARTEIMAVYARFIAGQNAHDRAMVADVLLDSKDFVWAQLSGASVWGREPALDAFQNVWKGTWKLDPQLQEFRIASPAPGVGVLITPLMFTTGEAGETPTTVPIRWGGVFVKTRSGWRLSSIFVAPWKNWHASGGN
jgi:hypothetical protein